MSGLFFLGMLIAIAWLAVWAVLPRPWKGGGWWPFDMREPDGDPPAPTARASGAARPRLGPARARR
ncbi:MAG TPA: hypothetical protein VN329_01260 [Roseomonas sp.]|nr:hypothetical protein [Roseomonas sp.]